MLIGEITTRVGIPDTNWLVLDGRFVIGYVWHTTERGPYSAYDLASRCVGEATDLDGAVALIARDRDKNREAAVKERHNQ